MARNTRKRSTKATTQESPEPGTGEDTPSTDATPPMSQDAGATDSQPEPQSDDKCPACSDGTAQQEKDSGEKESWVRCDACKTWFHWRCAGDGDLDAIGKWCAFDLNWRETAYITLNL